MTKDELITAVIKASKSPDLSKRAAGDIIDATFGVIAKAIKKEKRFAYPSFGTFTVRSRKAAKAGILRQAKKSKLRLVKQSVSNQPQL